MTDLSIYFPMVGMVGSLLLGIVLITYLASKALKVPEWEAYLNIELYELVLSFLLLVVAIGWYETMNAAAIAYVGVPATSQAALTSGASDFLQQMIEQGVLPGMLDTFKLQTCLSIWNMFSRRTGEFVLTITYKLFPGIDSFISVLNIIGFGMVAIYGSLTAQLVGMQLIDATMINFFLPAGILLRFLPPTREAGAFVIAFALGFGIVFPTTYLIHWRVFEDLHLTVYEPPDTSIWAMCGAQFPVAGLFNSIVLTNLPSIFGSSAPTVPIIGPTFNVVASEFGLNAVLSLWFTGVLEGMAALSLPAFFLPALSITITIAFISSTTKFILMKLG